MFFKFFCWSFYDKMIIIVRSIVKNYLNFLKYTKILITYAMSSTFIFSCIMTKFPKLAIFFYLYHVYLQIFLFKYSRFLSFDKISAVLFLITFFFLTLINYLHCILSYGFTKLFHGIFTTLYIMLIFFF